MENIDLDKLRAETRQLAEARALARTRERGWRKPSIINICQHCSKSFVGRNSRRTVAQKFCSPQCSSASRKVSDESKWLWQQAWYAKNKTKIIAKRKEQRDANPEAFLARERRWRKANKEKVAAYAANRRAYKKERKIERRRRKTKALLKAQNGKCAYCRSNLTEGITHIDHIIPRALGGGNEQSNLQLTCKTCNQRKHASHPIDFARKLGLLI